MNKKSLQQMCMVNIQMMTLVWVINVIMVLVY